MTLTQDQRTTITDKGITYNLALTDEMWDAWNVGRTRYEPGRVGGARLARFIITQEEAQIERLKVEHSPARAGRWCPPGQYMRLMLKRDPKGDPPPFDDEVWYTVMSDTPDEANDHADIISLAIGRVLIHGLGMGCLLSCVLANSDVEHVDVVEINKDVIDLIAPYYQDEIDAGRLTIHHDNCATKVWEKHRYWDVVWHDIWSSISDDNLVDDSEAEHGISYAKMHRKFGGRCSWQGSWGFEQSLWMRRVERNHKRRVQRFVRDWNERWSQERRAEELLKVTCPHGVGLEHWRESARHMPGLKGKGTAEQWRFDRAALPMTEEHAYSLLRKWV